MTQFDKAAADELMKTAVPPCVRDLGISVESIESDSAILRLRFSDYLCRDNGAVCGQSLMSLADTAIGFAICAANGAYLPMATIDQTMHFLKPAIRCDLLAEAKIIRLGRTTAFGTVSIRPDHDFKPVAIAQIAYSVLREEMKA
ncbi:uncharacterized protein (TIGR00369 family) [Bradyrhizobium japonicum]